MGSYFFRVKSTQSLSTHCFMILNFFKRFPHSFFESILFICPENSLSTIPCGKGSLLDQQWLLRKNSVLPPHPEEDCWGFVLPSPFCCCCRVGEKSSHLFLPLVSFWQTAAQVGAIQLTLLPGLGSPFRCKLLLFQLSSRLRHLHRNGIKLYPNKGRCHFK